MQFDVIIATDLRFPGGSSGSTLEEIRANHECGLRTGLYHLPASVLKRRRPFHYGILSELLGGKAELLNLAPDKASAKLLIYRHPSVIPVDKRPLPAIQADHVALIVNHPPVNSRGRIDYILPYAAKLLKERYNVDPAVYPIGPLVRSDLLNVYGNDVELAHDDWLNVFDIRRFECDRSPPVGTIQIGRHSRPGSEKWPDNADDILAAYPADHSAIHVEILGGAQAPEAILGFRPAKWNVHEFGSIAAEVFLKRIDVFVYFHHPSWTEAFGRVIVEAMASGLPVIVPHHFKPLLQNAAIYCNPSEVQDRVLSLLDPAFYMEMSRRASEYARSKFGRRTHIERLRKYGIEKRGYQ